MRRAVGLLLAGAALGGCAGSGPKYVRPPADNAAVRSGGGTGGSPTAATVNITADRIAPPGVRVTGGGTVTFGNRSQSSVQIRFSTPGAPNVGTLAAGVVRQVTFAEPGTYRFSAGSRAGTIVVL